jgi:hypothetical protein
MGGLLEIKGMLIAITSQRGNGLNLLDQIGTTTMSMSASTNPAGITIMLKLGI